MSASNTRQTESPQLRERVATNLRSAQAAKGFSNQEAADAVGAHIRLYAKWRAGDVMPSGGYLIALAETLLDGDVSVLFREVPVDAPASGKAAA